ncbi:hypothetical protein [Arthrobacter sp. UYCo732]|uniref:hypothetical protein n=1 Tax=Arthrobacter sp. UYCo732 TaxID=3156336 RepID=UPI0033993EA6
MASNFTGILSRVPAWAGTTKNLTGMGLASAGVLAELTLGLGPFWPAVIIGLYAAGALLAPPEKVNFTGALGSSTDLRKLKEDLAALDRRLLPNRNRLGQDVTAKVDALTGLLHDILDRGEALRGSPQQLNVVESTIHDYLPTSLETYLNLPRTYAMSSRQTGKKSAHEELLGQLDILAREAGKILDAVVENDSSALANQGRFLEDKFRPSSLDI